MSISFSQVERSEVWVPRVFAALLILSFASSCQSLRHRQAKSQPPRTGVVSPELPATGPVSTDLSSETSPLVHEDTEAPAVEPSETRTVPTLPKIGLIFGPGGARAFAHIGVLQEIQKEKVPVHAVAGIEWGSPIAGLYSMKGLANEAEWQMSKLKADEVVKKSLLGSSLGAEVSELSPFLRSAFSGAKAEQSRIPFACPALNLNKNQVFLMSRGPFEQLLPFCLAYPPLYRPWQGNVSGIREVKQVADHLRSLGANHIILINVLGRPQLKKSFAGEAGSSESVIWNELAHTYGKPLPGVDQVVSIPLEDYGILDFGKSREILQKGSERGSALVRQMARRLGL